MTVDTSQDTIAKHLKFYGIFSHIFYGKFSAEFVDESTFIGQHVEVRGMKALCAPGTLLQKDELDRDLL